MIRDIITNNNDDIAAISTGGGSSAIAVIRCSGQGVINKVSTLFSPSAKGKSLDKQKGYTQVFGQIKDGDKLIDEVIVSVYKAPHSFTGEDSVEISCHGSVYVQRKIMELLAKAGIRPARGGEFTMRAFAHGKYDLAQAEAVAYLIESVSASSHAIAMRHLKGKYSEKIKILRDEFINFASLMELELDFSEEDVEFADRKKFFELLDKIETEIKRLIESYSLGRVLKTGIPVAIIGKPNVGKSTLLNMLLEEDRAIISDIPGTTRDVIEDTVNIKGYLFRFIDTAGIRQSDDTVEKMGIERTFAKVKESSVVIYLTDEKGFDNEDLARVQELESAGKQVIKTINKIDLAQESPHHREDFIAISAKNKINTNAVEKALLDYVGKFNPEENNIVTEARHIDALEKTLLDLKNIRKGFADDIPTDLIAIDMRNAMQNLGEITGEITSGDLLSNIFGKFCIGK